MIEAPAGKRVGTPDDAGNVAAPLMGPDGGFITGSCPGRATGGRNDGGPATQGRPARGPVSPCVCETLCV